MNRIMEGGDQVYTPYAHAVIYARNCLTFVKTTAIAYEQNLKAVGNFLPICNSSRFYKQEITSIQYFKRENNNCGIKIFQGAD